jgi:hypothetical protein
MTNGVASDFRQSRSLETMNGSKPCGPSGGFQAPRPKRSTAVELTPCMSWSRAFLNRNPNPNRNLLSALEIKSMIKSKSKKCEPDLNSTVVPKRRRPGLRVPCSPSPRPSPQGEGERGHDAGKSDCCDCSPRFFVFRFVDTRQPSSVILAKHGRMFLPLLGERAGVRGNEANSNPTRTSISRTVDLRESPGRAGSFSI